MNLKKSFILICLIVCLFSIASVCASDVNDTANVDVSDNTHCDVVIADDSMVHHNESSVSEHNDNSSLGEWSHLDKDIQNLQPGDVYDIKNDYIKPNNASVIGIDIKADNVTINGNGHVIYGSINNRIKSSEIINGVGNIFTVSGNNIKINNLTISNAGYQVGTGSFHLSQDNTFKPNTDPNYYKENAKSIFGLGKYNFSPICWVGNNGICSDCVFKNNKAFAGGAITWIGNDGLLNNTKFINCSASRVGGAIYAVGNNLHDSNVSFVNVTSGWINGNVLYNSQAFVDIFYSSIDCNIFGRHMDFTKCLFNTLLYGGVQDYDGTLCYAQANDGDLAITFAKDVFDNPSVSLITLTQTFYFNNVVTNSTDYHQTADNILHAIASLNFSIDFKRTAVYNAYDKNSYLKSMDLKDKEVFKKIPDYIGYYLNVLPSSVVKPYIDALRVDIYDSVSKDGLSINSGKTWEPQNMGFNIVYIDGHNSIIDGGSGKRNEYKFASLSNAKCIFQVNNIVIKGFNNAIVNDGGNCICENVIFKNNKMDYRINQDFGAAIQNSGMTICNNCSFTNNYCSRGGAIFSQGYLILNNCNFKDNKGYRVGDNVLNVNKGQVFLDGDEIEGTSGVIHYEKSISTGLTKAIKWGSAAVSFLVGFTVGVITVNPLIGATAGAATGAVLGSVASVVTNRYTYDMHYNPLKNTLFTIGTCAATGIAGGIIGSYCHISFEDFPLRFMNWLQDPVM